MMDRETDTSLSAVCIQHTKLRNETLCHITIISYLSGIRYGLYRRAQLHHYLSDKRVNSLHGIGSKENAMVPQQQKARVPPVLFPIIRHFFPADRSENIAGFRRRNPNRIRKKLCRNLFACTTAGHAVDKRGMHMKNQLLREQVMEQRLHTGTFLLFSRAARGHHGREDFCLSRLFFRRKGHIPNFGKLCPIHFYKTVRINGSKPCSGPFDI